MIEDKYLPRPQKGLHHHRFKLIGCCANRDDLNMEYQYACKCGATRSELKSIVEMMVKNGS